MYFFTELVKLNAQTANGYGPVAANLTTQYEIGANFQLSGNARAFACEDSMMIVQQNATHSNLVNIILRPIKGLEVSSETVQYYVYRGILKTGFVTGSVITPKSTPGNSDFLERFWENWDNYKAETMFTGSDPTPKDAFGFDEIINQSDDILIENIFNNTTTGTRAVKVLAGEWIGNFDSTNDIAFEIITNSNHIQDIDTDNPDYLRMDLGYFRKEKHLVDVTNVDPVSGPPLSTEEKAFKLKIRREEVLSYIDPAAFYGLFYYKGVREVYDDGGTWKTKKLKKQNLYNDLIAKFDTKNRVYIDIRSEFGFSYNFYDNYQMTGTNALLKVKSDVAPAFVEDLYYTNEWPIFYAASWVGTNPKNRIELQFRVGNENPNPMVYMDNPRLKGAFNRKKFFFWDDLPAQSPDPNPDWTGSVKLKFPNVSGGSGDNIATYIRLQYFRNQKYDGDFPTKVLKSENDLDTVFGGLELPSIDGLSAVFEHNKSQRLQFVRGSEFSYASYPESYQDSSNNILFLTEIEYANKKKNSRRPKKQFKGNTITESPAFPQNMSFQKVLLREDDGSGTYNDVYSLDLVEFVSKKKKTASIEDVFALGLEKTEYDALVAAADSASMSDRHPRFIVFEKQTHLPEENGIPYDKYKLTLQGINKSGDLVTASPGSDIFVYTQGGQIFSTNAFATASNIPIGYPDPGYLKQWDHIGSAHYKYLNGTFKEIPDFGNNNNAGLVAPFKVNYNALVYFPADYEGAKTPAEISAVNTSYPLVVMIHGNGQFYEDYHRILKHLARNGFIAASIDCTLARDKIEMTSVSGYGLYTNYFSAGDETYGYDDTNDVLCVYDRVADSFPTANKKSWKSPDDYTISSSGGSDYIEFEKHLKYLSGAHGMGGLGRANTLFPHLEILKSKFGSSLMNKIGLMGHSRGGEAVLTAKRLIGTQTIANTSGIDNIDALFSLAPTDQFRIEKLTVNTPYFVMYGSKDQDVKTARMHSRQDPYDSNAVKNVVSGTGFSLWDRANNQEKTMAFIHGATHNGFATFNWADYNTTGGGVGYSAADYIAGEDMQQLMFDSYANAFFRKNLKSESFWSNMLSGEWTPPSIVDPDAKINIQYMHPGANDVENFASIGDDTDFSDGKASGILRKPIGGTTIDEYSQHSTKSVQLDIAKITTFEAYNGSGINANSFEFLSFRIARKYKVATDLTKMEIRLYNGGTKYTQLLKTEVPPAYKRYDPGHESRSKSALITVRASLDDFTGLDKTNITKIELYFGASVSGTVQLDDFQFTN